METSASPRLKKLKSPGQDATLNIKNSVTCTNVPEGLFDASAAKKHFSKFGRVQRIRLFPKREMCMIEYDQVSSAERAVLNAGAFDGFMFDVSRTKPRIRKRSKREDDPDWVPDSDVEEELSAMSGGPTHRISRQKAMEMDPPRKPVPKSVKQLPIRKKVTVQESQPVVPQVSGIESPVKVVTTQTTLSTLEAATELLQLRSRVSITPDEQWRTLDARDRILRAWGGAGSRMKVGGATIGTCRDMCPEKERLHRQAEHQVMTLETMVDTDGVLEPSRAVKQYSRSSADQEMPMCYELRPASALAMTCAYLLHEIADTKRQVSLPDWFHFLWDRFRGIRKDITQQALCCAESIRLVEMCARFHAHCAARCADLEHTQFDQKLNTDNLTKCLQTLKHMYADVGGAQKPREAEFRGYIALLNLGDSNFWWEIKQLPQEIQKSEPIMFAIKVFNALDNNNYVRFFRIVREKATYLQACILLRYFNDVRARALARIVKAFAPRGGSRYPADELNNALAFESLSVMKSFINHYGLRYAKSQDTECSVILDRNQFIEDSDPYPVGRELQLIESKRLSSVGQVIAGGTLPPKDYEEHSLQSSFNIDGTLNEAYLLGENLGYNTLNDTNKDIRSLKAEVQRLSQGGRGLNAETKFSFVKPEPRAVSPKVAPKKLVSNEMGASNLFSFKPAIPVAPIETISPEKNTNSRNIFSFSKPQDTAPSNIWPGKDSSNLLKPQAGNSLFDTKPPKNATNAFNPINVNNRSNDTNLLKKPDVVNPLFGLTNSNEKENKAVFGASNKQSGNLFKSVPNNLFSKKESVNDETKVSEPKTSNLFVQSNNNNLFAAKLESKNIFAKPDSKNLFATPESVAKPAISGNIFAKASGVQEEKSDPKSVFGGFKAGTFPDKASPFSQSTTVNGNVMVPHVFATNNNINNEAVSPGTLFKSVIKSQQNGSDTNAYSIFQSKNKNNESVAANIFNSVKNQQSEDIYAFDGQNEVSQKNVEEEIRREEEQKQENLKREHERLIELQRQKEEKLKEEAHKQYLEQQQREEVRKKAEEKRKQEELKNILEEEKRIADIKRKAEEEKRFAERVDKESTELIDQLADEVNRETVINYLREEMEHLRQLLSNADDLNIDILSEVSQEICESEAKAEKFLTEKLMKKWFTIWRKHFMRNVKRRSLLDGTPVWLSDQSPNEIAPILRTLVENSALKNMNAIHRGYRFSGELKLPPLPEPYNIMEIIKSPLLRRLKKVHYPYDKCFFWKATLIAPRGPKWLYKKIDLEKWLLEAFSDKKKHEISDSLIHVQKQSWNNLMDFAISVSFANTDNDYSQALEGTNGVLFYATESDTSFSETIAATLNHKYPYQIVPIAIVIPKMAGDSYCSSLESYLMNLQSSKCISCFKMFTVDAENVCQSLNTCTKSAMRWLAKNYPPTPPLEIDQLKSLCQRYLGNELWQRLKMERGSRLGEVLKDIVKLVNIYNSAVDKLTEVITNEDLFNYHSFPLEFQRYLDLNAPYPKPHEFISSNVKTSENVSAIRDIMKQLRLPAPHMSFQPVNADCMQDNIRSYCNQIGWFNDPEEVVCKVVANLPNEFNNHDLPCEEFRQIFENYDLLDLLNIIVYEKICALNNFNNRYAVYDTSTLHEYKTFYWWQTTDIVANIKHKVLEYEDDLDLAIEAKRRKIEQDSYGYLKLEDNDRTMVDINITCNDEKISQINNCREAVKQLEEQLEQGKQKSLQLEKILRSALSES